MTATHGKWTDKGKIKIADEPIIDGRGHTIIDKRGLFVIHSVLLHTGKVLWFCGHVEESHYALKSYLFDYKNPAAQLVSQDFPLHNPALARGTTELHTIHGGPHADLFCCHFVHSADGKVVVVGGSDPDYHIPIADGTPSHGSVGERYIYLFDPDTETWEVAQTGTRLNRLAFGRWYPTAVMLGDGRILVVSGRRESSFPRGAGPRPVTNRRGIAINSEVLDANDYSATTLTVAAPTPTFPLYPGLHLSPNGKVFYSHTTWGLEIDPPDTQSLELTPGSTAADWTDHAGVRPSQPRREEGMSLLLPPAQDGKVLLFGGSAANAAGGVRLLQAEPHPVTGSVPFDSIENTTDSKTSEILNTLGATPSWTAGPTLKQGRINGHGVILPNGKVLIFGGHDNYKWNSKTDSSPTNPSLESELFDPATNTTNAMASLNHPRMYHSAAVLLPDGTILVAGGADPNDTEMGVHGLPPDDFGFPANWEGPRFGGGMAYNRKDYEIYQPTYFFTSGTAPEIDSIKKNGAETSLIHYGESLVITSQQAASVDKVSLIRPGAATHHTDSEQRYVDLDKTINGNDITVTMPINNNLAPPGYYMLWILSSNGKPCKEAKFIKLAEPPPAGVGCGCDGCLVVSAAMGSQDVKEVFFLRSLRDQLSEHRSLGLPFIKIVNRLYYSVSPQISRIMKHNQALRYAMRKTLVLPAYRIIQRTAIALGYQEGKPIKNVKTLTLMLSTQGIIGIGLLPIICLGVGAQWLKELFFLKEDNQRESNDE